jgi:hypothetical protein
MISFEQSKHGDNVTYMVLPLDVTVFIASFVIALASACKTEDNV